MSKEEFISHMQALIYRIDAPDAQEILQQALRLYASNKPSREDQEKLREAEKLRSEATQLEEEVAWNFRIPVKTQNSDTTPE